MEDEFSSATSVLQAKAIIYPGRKMTWAGPGLTEERFLFGSEDGYIYESGIQAPLSESYPYPAVDQSESVNGVAHTVYGSALYVAASTRAEIKIHRFEEGHPPTSHHCDFGTHGIYPTAHKGFIAPLGPDGAVTIGPGPDGSFFRGELVSSGVKPYFYKLASLGQYGGGGQEIFAVACRSDGLAAIELPRYDRPKLIKLGKIRSTKFDFVGICSIGNQSSPRAVVALGRDRSMHFTRDLISDPHYTTLRFPASAGTAYKILSVRGHVLLLTARGLYVFANAAAGFLRGAQIGGWTTVRFLPVEAIDFNVAFEKWVLIVTPEQVIRVALRQLLTDDESQLPEAIMRRIRLELPRPTIPESEWEPLQGPIWNDISLESSLVPMEV
jgi:hypothetical protein